MSQFSKKIVNKIKRANIKPKSKWRFLIAHLIIWLALVTSIFLGGFALSLIFRMLTSAPWEVISRVGPSPVQSILAIIPYLWIFVLIILFITSHYLVRLTKKGYRYTPLQIMAASLIGSMVLGALLFITHLDHSIERYLVHEFSPYGEWQKKRGVRWVSAKNGLLTGFIIEVDDEEEIFELEDLSREDWEVDFSKVGNKARSLIIEGQSISILGKVIEDSKFSAEKIRLWTRGELHTPFRKRLPKHRVNKMPR